MKEAGGADGTAVCSDTGVNATLASILGRDAARKGGVFTWDEMIRENRRLEVDTSGLSL